MINNYNDIYLDRSGVENAWRVGLPFYQKLVVPNPGGANRIGFSKEEKQAKLLEMKWMAEAGMEIKEDGAGNMFGRFQGRDKNLPILLSYCI
ncbi:hypothetical protein [Peribacillus sp. NPDC058002]|uniref:hypothetical protein n=1 Tax=Peribacillus sp. NPDC058002 TaxID=3346301 RepID=UPI0036DCBF33